MEKVKNESNVNKTSKREKVELKKTNKYEFYTAKINKSRVIAETKDAVLVVIKDKLSIWFSKKFVKFSNYSNLLTITFTEDYNYNGYNNEKEVEVIGHDLIEFFNAEKQ